MYVMYKVVQTVTNNDSKSKAVILYPSEVY